MNVANGAAAFAREFADFLDGQVTLEPYLGTGAHGETWGPAQTVEQVQVEESTTLSRSADATDRTPVASLALPASGPDFPIGSRVTLPSGRVGTVMRSATNTREVIGWAFRQVVVGA